MGGDAALKARDGRISCFWHHTGQGLLAHMLTSLLRCLKSWSCLIWGSKYCAHILKSECQQASISPPCWVKVEYEIRCNNCLLNKNKKLFVKKQDRGAGWLVDWGCYWLVRSFTSGIYRVWQVLEPLIQWMEAAGKMTHLKTTHEFIEIVLCTVGPVLFAGHVIRWPVLLAVRFATL